MRSTTIVALCLWVLAGCSFHVDVDDYGAYSGLQAAQQINARWRPVLIAESPLLHVGNATCPRSLDIADGRAAYCATSVNGQRLRIRVTLVNGNPYYRGVGSIFSRSSIEHTGESFGITDYGIDAPVHCPPPDWRILEPKQKIRCIWAVPQHARTMTFEGVDSNGHFRALPVAHMTAISPVLSHSHGKVTINGALLARSMDLALQDRLSSERVLWPDLVQNLHFQPTACPNKVRLDAIRRTVCQIRVNGMTIGIDGWVDNGAWRTMTHKYVFWGPGLSKNTADAIARADASDGDMSRIRVDCGISGVVALAPGDDLTCRYQHGTDDGHVRIHLNQDGQYVFKIIE